MRNEERLFVDVHAIQTLPPSNINRDDTGSPKTAQYGGVKRARVSSQSWKRAIREYFYNNSEQANVGVRTLSIVDYVARKIIKKNPSMNYEDAAKLADKTINSVGIKTKDQKAKALFFLGDIQADKLAEAAINGVTSKDELKNILNDNPSIDIALFGRMVADDPSLNEDASCQVAHSISTHAIQNEFDFFTAVDDLHAEDNAGAGMLGNVEFNSSTLYRYANISVHELSRQLNDKEAVVNTVKLFIEAFSNSLPIGKVNTFANQTVPNAVVVIIREDRPTNLVGAFEEPIRSNNGFVNKSIYKLAVEIKKSEKFVKKPKYSVHVSTENVENLKEVSEEKNSLGELIDSVSNIIEEALL